MSNYPLSRIKCITIILKITGWSRIRWIRDEPGREYWRATLLVAVQLYIYVLLKWHDIDFFPYIYYIYIYIYHIYNIQTSILHWPVDKINELKFLY